MAVIQKLRKSFGKSFFKTALPDLVDIQYGSYKDFLQADVEPSARKNIGLQKVFSSVFPIKDSGGLADLEFIEYKLDKPLYNVKECMLRDLTYSRKLKLKLRLVLWNILEDGKKELREIKEQEVFMGEVPLMTERGSIIISGVEKVVISQMHRSQGVIFAKTKESRIAGNPTTYTARIIPERGSWIDFEEAKGVIYVRIDRRRKITATTFLRCLPSIDDEKKLVADPRKLSIKGMSDTEILSNFYNKIELSLISNDLWSGDLSSFDGLKNYRLNYDLLNVKDGKVILSKGERLNARNLSKISDKKFALKSESLIGCFLFDPVIVDEQVIYNSGTEITEDVLSGLLKMDIKNLSIIAIDNKTISSHIRNTLVADNSSSREEALIEIYNIIRPGERPTIEAAANLFARQGFDSRFYDMSAVGRFKMNKRLKLDSDKDPDEERLLSKKDVLRILKVLINIIDGNDTIDDIDSLSNRRIRTVGELFEQNFKAGMAQVERNIKEALSSANNMQPQDIVDAKPLMSVLSEFLRISPLSQFMEAYNPLAELENKRVISALGPGGLNRDRAGIEVRDVHPTHYVVENGKITDKMVYLTSDEEYGHKIAQGNTPINSDGMLIEDNVTARVDGDFTTISKEEIDLIDVEPRQIVSISTGLIPFVENDDSNRALMGSNMQRQAIPLLRSDAPLVGTGIEREVAKDSRTGKIAKHSGVVESVDSSRIVVKCMNSRNVVTGVDIYDLEKFERSNHDTLIHQKPLVKVGDKVSVGDTLADGSCMNYGELAIGKNVLVAFMPWRGYNYEDGIVISERISRDDVFTSIKIVEKEFTIRDTQIGPESFTRDIPNVSEDALKNLDESGIIYIGARVKQGDILVGRVSPKSETLLSPEEALLRDIFGEKALNVKDTSLRVGPNEEGTVIGVNVLTKHGVKKDERTQMIELQRIESINRNRDEKISIMEKSFADQIFQIAEGNIIDNASGSLKPFIGKKLTAEVFEKYYKDITDFGILINNNLITGLRTYKLDKIITQYIKNGSLIYFTKYKNQSQIKYLKPINVDTPGNCPKGTIMTYKFGRYVCLEKNKQFACIGDTIWDKKKEKCVPNYFNRPVCAENMVAILKNNVWECLDSIEQNTEIQCAENQIKTYNKYSQKYICTEDPNKQIDIKKCTFEKTNLVYGKLGSTLKIQKISTKCNECEKQIINEDTCESFCIPDKTKLNNQNCYKNAQECAGNNKSFYFGFPNQEYVKNVKEVYNYKTPINSEYSKNRKFNCKKCEKGINEEKSIYPLILICN